MPTDKSDSTEQKNAEKYILKALEKNSNSNFNLITILVLE